jgi:hypothetical protein
MTAPDAKPGHEGERDVEPFVVKHYGSDAHPSIKGNGFDGLVLGENREEAQDFIDWVNARLRARPAEPSAAAGGVPAGWRLVPVEPTEEMIMAGTEAWEKNNHGSPYEREIPMIYAAILSASPAPGAQDEKGVEG